MGQQRYSYNKNLETRYSFTSRGKRNIKKVVEFSPTSFGNLYNMGFGDLLQDGSTDDTSNSNNGDIVKVLATVIHILKEFTHVHPHIKVVFTGTTKERTLLYRRILKSNLSEFSKNFIISGLIKKGDRYTEINFEPDKEVEYEAFFIKKIT